MFSQIMKTITVLLNALRWVSTSRRQRVSISTRIQTSQFRQKWTDDRRHSARNPVQCIWHAESTATVFNNASRWQFRCGVLHSWDAATSSLWANDWLPACLQCKWSYCLRRCTNFETLNRRAI